LETTKIAKMLRKNVIISTNVMKKNLKYLPQLCDLAKKLECSIELYPCEDIVRQYKGEIYKIRDIEKLIPNIESWGKLIKSLRKNYKNLLTDYSSVEIIEKGGFGGNPKYQNILRCHVAEAYLFIRHDGMISYPCKINPIASFDTSKYSIKEIYYSKEVKEIMKKYDGFDFCNACRLGCAITSSLPTHYKTAYHKYIQGFLDGNLR
jgi:MoaA/NifB/PqqE/SkfB family radical SAM enzyme